MPINLLWLVGGSSKTCFWNKYSLYSNKKLTFYPKTEEKKQHNFSLWIKTHLPFSFDENVILFTLKNFEGE